MNEAMKTLLHQLANADKLVMRKGSPNPRTRKGMYYDITIGLSHQSFFVGYDLEHSNKLIVEVVG